MSRIVDHVADLTGYRDRDVLDTMLVTVLRDLLQPRSVAICHAAGIEPHRHWLVRARMTADDIAAQSDQAWVDATSAPPLDAFPARLACLSQVESIEVRGHGAHMTYFPLLTDSDVAGVLEIESDAPLDVNQLRMVGSMLRVYRNVQGLLDYSERDGLTGLLNRKTFDSAFSKVTNAPPQPMSTPAGERRDARADRHVYVGVIDVDHFKAVNDRHGHLIGDEVLLLLSRLMRAAFRYGDHLYRFGGEEFVVLLRCDGDEHAAGAFERLRAATAGYAFPLVGHITVSIGFTRVRPGDTPTSAFERADEAVYWVKGHGRNQVRGHESLVLDGEVTEEERGGAVEFF